MNKNKAVFLDRDGVINVPIFKNNRSYAPQTIMDFKIYDEALSTLQVVKSMGYKVVIVTNQPDVGNKKIKKENIEKMHEILIKKLPIDLIKTCYHSQTDNCQCRKPNIKLFQEASYDLDIDFSKSYMVGDRWSDIEAGQKIGCKCIFIDHKYIEKKPIEPYFITNELKNILDFII